ncbi:unnamed protein product, partial [Pylaiella littoralis]
LAGTIPPELGNLAALEYLELEENELTGEIILRILSLPAQFALSLPLAGTIPPELGNLAALEYLRLDGNELSGPIPKELGDLTELVELVLYRNQLTGPIPPELGALRELKTLELNKNQLTGTIPPQLGNLAALEYLRLQDNELSGESLGTSVSRSYVKNEEADRRACVVPLAIGEVPKSLRDHPNRKTTVAFQFHVLDDGQPLPTYSWASVLFPLVVGYVDLGTDVAAVVSYYEAGHAWWFALGMVFIVGPALFAGCVVVRGTDNLVLFGRCCIVFHLGLLWEAFVSAVTSSYSHTLVTLKLVEALYESTPQLMLQFYVLLLEWGGEGAQWPFWRIFSVVWSGFTLAYTTTGLVVEYPLSQRPPGAEGSTARCPSLTSKIFSGVPTDGSVEVYGSRWHPQNFVWAFLLYQWLEIGSRIVSLALLALVVRAYFFLVLSWLWISRSIILRHLRYRSQLRLVGMPFMDSIMDALKSYDVGCALTTVEFVIFASISNYFYENEEGKAPDSVRRVWTYVAAVCMVGKLALGFLVVRPFKRE